MADLQRRDPNTAVSRTEDSGRWRLSMSSILILSFGSLISVSLLLVLGFTLVGATRNTVNLLRERAELGIALIAKEVDTHLQSASNQASFVASMVESGRIDVADRDRLATLMFGAMAADPAIGAVAFVFPDGEAEVVDRLADPARHYRVQLGSDPLVRRGLRYGRGNVRPVWLPPAYRPDIERTILTLERPVRRNGEFLGVLASVISVGSLSERLKSAFGTLGSNVFVLYGKDRVLAHTLMATGYPGLTVEKPLPSVAGFGDSILAAMWKSDSIRPLRIDLEPPLQGHVARIDDVDHVFVYRKIEAYTAVPIYAGAHFRSEVVAGELERLRDSIIVGLAAVAASILLAVFIGRRLARPVTRLSAAARLIGQMNLDDIRDLPPSRVRELDQQSSAFNAMNGALKWFQAYVPRALVRQLLTAGDLAGLESDRRNVTVMFTDIAGYSTVSEGKSASEIAALLNRHFSILTEEIEAQSGTVDKFIGDSVMAFWGAPEKQKDRAAHACRAALAIRRRIAEDNERRAAAGEPPVRVRIGIQSGEATAGNIGSRSRLNYTVIGDTVNIAQRLEQLGKEVSPDDEVAIVVGAATAADAGSDFAFEPVGDMAVKGRAAPVEVHRLLGMQD